MTEARKTHVPIDWIKAATVLSENEVKILQALQVSTIIDPLAFKKQQTYEPCIGSIFCLGSGSETFDDGLATLNGTLLVWPGVWDQYSDRTIEDAGYAYYEAVFGESLKEAKMCSAHPLHTLKI